MMNEFQRRVLAEAAKFGGKFVSNSEKIANKLNEAPAVAAGGMSGLFGYSKQQFEMKMRQLIQKMGFEKGITRMDITDKGMTLHFANAAKARDFVITFNGLTKRQSKGSAASISTSFDKAKAPAGSNAIVTVDFSMMKMEGVENPSHLFIVLEVLHEEYVAESATKAAIEDFMYDTLTKAAIAELKPIVKSKTGDRMKKIEAVLKKHKIPTTSPIGGKSAQLVADFFDSFHGESMEENNKELIEVQQIDKVTPTLPFAKFRIGGVEVTLSVDPKDKNTILSKSSTGTKRVAKLDFLEFFVGKYPVRQGSALNIPKDLAPKDHFSIDYGDGAGWDYDWYVGSHWTNLFIGKTGGSLLEWGQHGNSQPKASNYPEWRKAVVAAYKGSIKEEVQKELVDEAFRFRQQDWEKMRAKYKQGTPVNITLKSGKTVSGTLLRMDKYDQGSATKGHLLHIKTSSGKVKIDDVDVKSIQWNNDPKTKMSEEVEVTEARKGVLPAGFKKGELLWLPGSNKRGQLVSWKPVDGVVGGIFTVVLPDKTVRRIIAQDIFRANSTKMLNPNKLRTVSVEEKEVNEQFKTGDKVKVPHKGKMVSGKIVRFDSGGTDKARQHGGGYVVDIGEPASILVPKQNVRTEEVEGVEEAYAPLDTPNIIGAFTEASKKKRFEYRKSTNKWGISHDLPHEVCVKETSPSEWRAANVKGTVCYIATDEGEGGKPVIEKWAIRNHVKYVKAESVEETKSNNVNTLNELRLPTKGEYDQIAKNLATKKLKREVTKQAIMHAGTKAITAIGSKTLLRTSIKTLGKDTTRFMLKKVPLVGLALGGVFAWNRIKKGEYIKAAVEVVGGIASTFPGFGTAAAIACDVFLISGDVYKIYDMKKDLKKVNDGQMSHDQFKKKYRLENLKNEAVNHPKYEEIENAVNELLVEMKQQEGKVIEE